MKKYFLTGILFLLLINVSGQFFKSDRDEKVVQLSGIVVEADSITPVPFAHILIKGKKLGTITDYYGYFSFVIFKGDTVLFSAVGKKTGAVWIPDTIPGDRYSLVQVLEQDTIVLPPAVVYPWPSKEVFKEVFINTEIPDDDIEIARKNMEGEVIRKYAAMMPNTGSMNFRQSMNVIQQKLYYNGQLPPNPIFNPFAWAKFIKAWKNGDFKRKK